jgi:hypothetical protein
VDTFSFTRHHLVAAADAGVVDMRNNSMDVPIPFLDSFEEENESGKNV